MTAPLLAVGAAMCFALGAQFASLGLRNMDSRSGSFVTIATSMLLFWIISPLYLKFEYFLTFAAVVFASIGLFRPLLSANLAHFGNKLLGPTRSSTLASTAPFFGVAMGVLFLNEALSWQTAVGTLAIVGGVMLLSSRRGSGPQSWPLWAILVPIGAAFLRAAAQVLTKFGMQSLPDPLFAGLMAYSVSFVLALFSENVLSEQARRKLVAPGLMWFVGAGTVNGFGIMNLNAALNIGTVTEVAPVVACSPLFTLLLSVLIFRRETITLLTTAAVSLVVAGLMLIVLHG